MSRMLLPCSLLPCSLLPCWLLMAVALTTAGCRSGASTGESIAPPMSAIPVGAPDATGADYAPPPPLPGATAVDPDGTPHGLSPRPGPLGVDPSPDPPDELQSPFDPPPTPPEPPVPPGTDL